MRERNTAGTETGAQATSTGKPENPAAGLLRKGAIVFAGHGGAAILSFVRNVIVARALGVEEFGIASTFAVIFAFVETATDTGLEKMIVRDKEGDDDAFLGTMHTIFLIRGVLSSTLMLIMAGPFASYMGLEDIAWAYQILALGPLTRGFVHFDMFRLQRHMNFRGLVSATLAAPAMGIAIVIIGTFFIQDFRVVLWSLIGYQVAFVAASHITAERGYRYRWSWTVARRGLHFGLPLFLNGFLLFAILQGDRLIIGGEIGVEVLGWYSVAWLLASTPTFVVINTIRSIFLPKLADGVHEHGLDRDLVTATVQAGCLAAVGLIIGFFALGPIVLLSVYGAKFSAALEVLQPIAIGFGMRLMVASITTLALAGADTRTPLLCGAVRILFLIPAYFAAVNGYGAVTLAWIAMVGEFTSALAGGRRIIRKCDLDPRPWYPALALVGCSAVIALAFDRLIIQPGTNPNPTLWMLAVFAILAVATPFTLSRLFTTLGLIRARS